MSPFKHLSGPKVLRQEVRYDTNEPPGTIVVNTPARFLHLGQPGGHPRRYGVGIVPDEAL